MSPQILRPFNTACPHWGLSEAVASQESRLFAKAIRSLLQTSSYLRWGLLPVGRFPCDSSPYKRSFGKWPSSIRTTWPDHCILLENGEHGRNPCSLKESAVKDLVLPGDAQDAAEVSNAYVKVCLLICLCKSMFLPSKQGPWRRGACSPHKPCRLGSCYSETGVASRVCEAWV